MFCAISGNSPIEPVISAKSGLVYEKKLILKYMKENAGKDPVTAEVLEEGDLVHVKTVPSAPAAPPRPPTLSSVPALLHLLQNEWDATMLECFELRKQNSALRQELSHALYKEDAATRVLARLMRERDEAREALGSVQASLGQGQGQAQGQAQENGNREDVAMEEVSAGGLASQVVQRIDATAATLSAARKKRKPPAGYATPADLKSYSEKSTIPSLHSTKPPGVTCMAVAGAEGQLLITGGMDKCVEVYDRTSGKVLATLKGHTKKVNAVAVVGADEAAAESLPPFIIAGSADKTVRVWGHGSGKAAYTSAGVLKGHTGEVTGVSVHPSGTLVLSSSLDGSWALHDLAHSSGHPHTLLTVSLDGVPEGTGVTAVQWHPDGQILGTGATDGAVRVFDVKAGNCLATFEGHGEGTGAIRSVSFSENGYLLATVAEKGQDVRLWDLRKMKLYHAITLPEELGASIVAWDASAQYLSVVGSELRVWQSKTWEELVRFDGNAAELTGVSVVNGGKEVLVAGMDRTVRVLGAP